MAESGPTGVVREGPLSAHSCRSANNRYHLLRRTLTGTKR